MFTLSRGRMIKRKGGTSLHTHTWWQSWSWWPSTTYAYRHKDTKSHPLTLSVSGREMVVFEMMRPSIPVLLATSAISFFSCYVYVYKCVKKKRSWVHRERTTIRRSRGKLFSSPLLSSLHIWARKRKRKERDYSHHPSDPEQSWSIKVQVCHLDLYNREPREGQTDCISHPTSPFYLPLLCMYDDGWLPSSPTLLLTYSWDTFYAWLLWSKLPFVISFVTYVSQEY